MDDHHLARLMSDVLRQLKQHLVVFCWVIHPPLVAVVINT